MVKFESIGLRDTILLTIIVLRLFTSQNKYNDLVKGKLFFFFSDRKIFDQFDEIIRIKILFNLPPSLNHPVNESGIGKLDK